VVQLLINELRSVFHAKQADATGRLQVALATRMEQRCDAQWRHVHTWMQIVAVRALRETF
jgi:hypothetical protein